jgi:hypothetical protein
VINVFKLGRRVSGDLVRFWPFSVAFSMDIWQFIHEMDVNIRLVPPLHVPVSRAQGHSIRMSVVKALRGLDPAVLVETENRSAKLAQPVGALGAPTRPRQLR